jgi:hypothetical protein
VTLRYKWKVALEVSQASIELETVKCGFVSRQIIYLARYESVSVSGRLA